VNKSCGKGVAGADCVHNNNPKTGMLGRACFSDQQAATTAASDADQLRPGGVEQRLGRASLLT